MTEVILVLDESGAKGYSDNQENYPGELGVMAGYLVPANQLASLNASLEAIRNQFAINGKLHITGLSTEQQGALRQAIYNCLQQANVRWVYEAIYVQGLHELNANCNVLKKQLHASRRSTVKVPWREQRESLHALLFTGTFGKAIAYCVDEIGGPCSLNIITDRTDQTILKQFTAEADTLLNWSAKEVRLGSGFDTKTKEVVHGTVTSMVYAPQELVDEFSQISYTLKCEDSALTLAADVLVNGLHHHLKNRPNTPNGAQLNDAVAVAGHPLQAQVYGTCDDKGFDFSDSVFGHPIRK